MLESGLSPNIIRRTPFMMIVAFIISCVYLFGLIVLAAALLRAPEGFEDQEGFHAGRGPLTDDPAL